MNRRPLLPEWIGLPSVFVGVIHLLPLPGSPKYAGSLPAVRDAAMADAETLAQGGAHGILIENYGDAPYWPRGVPPAVLTHMAVLAAQVRRTVRLPVGVNVLRNDGLGAMAVAHAADLAFIRVNVLCGAVVADQGVLQGMAHRLLRLRSALGASVAVWADVRVKHASPLAPRALADEVHDTIDRGGADAIIVTGPATGQPVSLAELTMVVEAAATTPVLVGSGARPETIAAMGPLVSGFIVGSALRPEGRLDMPIDLDHVRHFAAALQAAAPAQGGERREPPTQG